MSARPNLSSAGTHHSVPPGAEKPESEPEHWLGALTDGTHILIRSLEAKDREREFSFIKNLSPESRHFRFLSSMNEPGAALLDQLMDVDHKTRVAYVALHMGDGVLNEVGVARYAPTENDAECESAVVIADKWQGKGLGVLLMKHLIETAHLNGYKRMISMDTAINSHMRHLAQELGFTCEQDPMDATKVLFRKRLN